MPMTYQEIRAQQERLERFFNEENKILRDRLERLRAECKHPQLPKRGLFEEHNDTCPDCGAHFYLHYI